MAVETPLGDDTLLLSSFRGHEEISRLSSFHLEMLSETSGIAARDLVGKPMTVSLLDPDDTPRRFHGYVKSFVYCGTDDRFSRYQAEVVPWFWLLTLRNDCRIFQEKSIPDIVRDIFGEFSFADFDDSGLQGSYEPLEYCVQYRESSFAFVSRLLERAGIFYFFRSGTLVLGDHVGAYDDCADGAVSYGKSSVGAGDELSAWHHSYEMRSGRYSHVDYNFENPAQELLASAETLMEFDDLAPFEVYDYPGGYREKDAGADLAKARMQEAETGHEGTAGAGPCRSFQPGGKFKIDKHSDPAEEGNDYVLVSVEHIANASYDSGVSGAGAVYENRFTAIPAKTQFRPARTTAKAVVHGSQTAVVTGPDGEEIYTDSHGRVRVQFHWDRNTGPDASCWVRVAQAWAGSGWGAIHIPRIGQEVVVTFLEGDIDQPLITGSVYNGTNATPYTLPDNATQSGIRTASTKSGGPDNFNEIRFEDLKGHEELYFQAEKDHNILVKNNRSETIGHDETVRVENDRSESVGNDEQLTVEKKRSRTVGESETVSIGEDQTISVSGNQTITVGGDESDDVTKSRTTTVGKDESLTVAEQRKVEVGKDDSLKVAGSRAVDVTKKLVIEAGDQIVLQSGKAKISLKKDGTIQIEGSKISIKGSGKVAIKGSAITQN